MASTIRVLHVEDEPDIADLTARFLDRELDHVEITHATDASEALERLDETVDCVVSDYEMPGQNGIDFLAAVREECPDLPFILFTGKGSEQVASEAISAGVTDYLQKGAGSDQYAILANRIRNAVKGHRSRAALEARNRELQLFERIFDTIHEGAAVYDAEGRYRIVNDFLVDLYDRPRADLEGEPSRLVRRVRQAADGDPFQDLVEGRRPHLQGEVEIEVPDRGEVVFEYRMTPLTVDGTLEGVVSVGRDVTERRERERQLEQAREEYEELIDGMNDTAWVIDVDGEFRAVNDAAVERLGYSREELLDMRPQDIDAGLEDQEIADLIENMPEDEFQVFETAHETKDGETFPVEISSSLVTYHGETVILSVGRDISARKKREARLEEFASVVSHDLRNPLNVAQGRLQLAREECDSEHLDDVNRAHDRMAALIDDLLQLAREGHRIDETEAVDLATVVENCWETVQTGEATLVATDVGSVEADRSRLRQLFENLVRNAIEHGGSEVTVTVGRLEDGFYVEDDGVGIPSDEHESVFDLGYTSSRDGTGFGLSIVKQIAEAHGWEVAVTEGTEGGARFEFTGVSFEGT